jgi:hypothetical protein
MPETRYLKFHGRKTIVRITVTIAMEDSPMKRDSVGNKRIDLDAPLLHVLFPGHCEKVLTMRNSSLEIEMPVNAGLLIKPRQRR